MRQPVRLAALLLLTVAALSGCGDDGPSGPVTPTPPPERASAAIEAAGNGFIVVSPSANPAFAVAITFPVRIQETAGGTAIWNFFRVSYFLNGVQIERFELGADGIRDAGYRDIGARSTIEASVVTRANRSDWDDFELRLGFIDNLDGRQFEQVLSLDSFEGVGIDFDPAVRPEGSASAVR